MRTNPAKLLKQYDRTYRPEAATATYESCEQPPKKSFEEAVFILASALSRTVPFYLKPLGPAFHQFQELRCLHEGIYRLLNFCYFFLGNLRRELQYHKMSYIHLHIRDLKTSVATST